MEYFYKIKHKFIKKRKNDFREIENYGFNLYSSDDNEEFFALGIKIDVESEISKNAKKLLEHFYKDASEEQREQDFEGWEFKKGENECFELVMNENTEKELTNMQLCFCLKGKTANTLFINGVDGREYYNTKILDENIKDIIDYLLKNKVIYKTKANFEWKMVNKK